MNESVTHAYLRQELDVGISDVVVEREDLHYACVAVGSHRQRVTVDLGLHRVKVTMGGGGCVRWGGVLGWGKGEGREASSV